MVVYASFAYGNFSVIRLKRQILWKLAEKLIEVKLSMSEKDEEHTDKTIACWKEEQSKGESVHHWKTEISYELPSVIDWKSLTPEQRKPWQVKLHAQLRAMVNTACLPSPDKIADATKEYKEVFRM